MEMRKFFLSSSNQIISTICVTGVCIQWKPEVLSGIIEVRLILCVLYKKGDPVRYTPK